ncbi:MAG: hypothetical protein RL412_102 [Pseudomonadota bacterium]
MSTRFVIRWTPLVELGLSALTALSLIAARGGDFHAVPAITLLILVPSIMWGLSVRLVDSSSSSSATLYRVANTLALVALGVPVVAGEVHWGIVVLPFALFRIAMNAASKSHGARAVTQRIQWIGGVWVAGWASVLP